MAPPVFKLKNILYIFSWGLIFYLARTCDVLWISGSSGSGPPDLLLLVKCMASYGVWIAGHLINAPN